MKVDTVVTLANNKEYLLLLESKLVGEDYFLAVLLDSRGEPTVDYAVLKKVIKDGEEYAQKINNVEILKELLEDYGEQYADLYGDGEEA